MYRAYDAKHGKWLNRDPIGEAGGLNLYGYAGGNSVNFTDPSGLIIPVGPILIGAFEGAIVSAADDAAGQVLNSSSNCIDWNQVGESALLGAVFGGIGGGVGAGEGSACFSGETLVATESGERPIEDIKVGEKVWSKDADGGDLELRSVERRYITPNQDLIDLEIVADDGRDEVFRATATHRFWVDGAGWTVAGDLKAGDVVELRSGKQAVFERAEKERGKTTVYNLEVDGTHTYFVGDSGVWVHNGCVPSTLARVIPGDVDYPTLGRPADGDVFVTAAEDIAGMTPAEISQALAIPPSPSFTVYEFPTPEEGLASPILRSNPGFTGGGTTAGGASEFVISNGPIPPGASRYVVK